MTRRELRGAALVAATYAYFLIFAEFAFIELARPTTGDGSGLRGVMAALGAGGAMGGVAAAALHRAHRAGRGLAAWLAGCALAALSALAAPRAGVAGFAVAGLLVGLALGGATVWLASSLRAMVGGRRLGLVTGLGTGAAYALCNLPVVFTAYPATQTGLAAAGAAAGAWLAWRTPAEADESDTRATVPVAKTVAPWVAVFLALVWMDSAAFYIIQHAEALKAATWAGGATLLANAAVHLGAAVLAGLLLDRGRAGLVALVAGLGLAAACRWILNTGAGFAYMAGVSFYSAALVYVPARLARPATAAAIFALSGWGGSALGIGMAQDLGSVPAWFGPAALALVSAGLWFLRGVGRVATVSVAVALAAGVAGVGRADAAEPDAAVLRGREVYVAEGCIHCHSQYVRPGTEDVPRWGPARDLAELLAERPPLLGNRRQGPDLLNVGNRRTSEWNRLHLMSPREISPGSRMPSYARLFARGETRGEDLLAYLASRGEGTEAERAAETAAWRPSPNAWTEPEDARGGAAAFARFCAQCHGRDGRGDGPIVTRLEVKPADLTRAQMDRDAERLARIIKFGRPGTAMAGHESLDDETVVSLARHVAALQSARPEK